METTHHQQKIIAKIIERELGFTNGWSISDKDYTDHCDKASKKIAIYLKRTKK